MGRYLNHHDEQDRWLNKAKKLNRNNTEREPGSLSLAEQFELARQINKEEREKKEREKLKKEEENNRHNFSHYVPKVKKDENI